MSQQSQYGARVRAARVQYEQRCAEMIPAQIEAELMALTVPSEARGTPRGDVPSRPLAQLLRRFRRTEKGVRPFAHLWAVLSFRIRRGEPAHVVVAPLNLLAAQLVSDPAELKRKPSAELLAMLDDLLDQDAVAEAQSMCAARRRDYAAVARCEASELSAQIIAIANELELRGCRRSVS